VGLFLWNKLTWLIKFGELNSQLILSELDLLDLLDLYNK